MIKNIVFDFGNVLVRFDPLYMTKKYINDENDARLVAAVLFDRSYWDKLDAGTISDSDVISLSCKRIPERLHNNVESVYYNWIYNLPEIDGMRDVIKNEKRLGKHVFLLSNISKYFAAHANEIPILSEFEKCIFSSTAGHIKPNADIFEYLCRECNILPNETLFIDDSKSNVNGAKAFGIEAYLFDGDVNKLAEYLSKIT